MVVKFLRVLCLYLVGVVLSMLLNACGSGGNSRDTASSETGATSSTPAPTSTNTPTPSSTPAANIGNGLIKLNQLGFYPNANKVAVVPANATNNFALFNENGEQVFQGQLGTVNTWPHSDESVRLADFSGFNTAGNYRLRIDGIPDSDTFKIDDNVHRLLNSAALKAFYYNRAGMAISAPYAGDWSRTAGHADTEVKIHASAASELRPTGTRITSPMGWYDAGDYNKYIVNSGISTYTLLAAYEHYPDYYRTQNNNIPESGNPLPDILDEVLWNLRWMLTMQDPNDGGVYHKLTTLRFSGQVLPQDADAQRYVVQKSTAAALNFAAVMAVASRIFSEFETHLPGLSEQCRTAALNAWQWAKNNPEVAYRQPSDVFTGEYASAGYRDEFAWAAAELYITLNDDSYYQQFTQYRAEPSVPSWGYTVALGYMSLLHHAQRLSGVADIASIRTSFLSFADDLRNGVNSSAFGIVMGREASEFVWGSNAVALNQSMMLIQAFRDSGERSYADAALTNMDYILGRNGVGISFVTGFGTRSPLAIHHRPSAADSVAAPIPGFVAGGPQPGQQDGCSYPSALPAKSYLDDWCSYSTNEIAINWNAPLVYVSGALEVIF
ncbi:glycoside hydrolase family 9 protein [Agarilytica rhodophyticola]|uniref:glycoside hydrolase family 9 protein n=1 Tax=Agarilytica rhodophyticola TaxID=1737490 RepID=UPI000B344A69|nr:glycoside hydrolase family 9 protein [Agarilytica rhodophyticola]